MPALPLASDKLNMVNERHDHKNHVIKIVKSWPLASASHHFWQGGAILFKRIRISLCTFIRDIRPIGAYAPSAKRLEILRKVL